ncbi:N-acyl-L-homoserine lactone synthetase [Duganella sacchari]|uniref:Acyl-homoserine-lactone synthase n=1 Tax=Duganella sacchari TaxID=551987 RepID=A0A1M7KYN4_9BURK|nr:acyl-homoserine-lactone synthase [Duganella sacchari]SHM70691.1 N-acyl-L-homoserine lactone synthetase [Duganella sacchari]
MRITVGTASTLGPERMAKLTRYRHQVFVEKLGWDLDLRDGQELDQFDHDDTVYLVAWDEQDRVGGCARLLPTTRPYLLQEVFPQLLNGAPAPRSDEVWELSRFAAVDPEAVSTPAAGQLSSAATLQLLAAAVESAAERGARRLITVSPPGVERLLRRTPFRIRAAGPRMDVGTHALFACWIDAANDHDERAVLPRRHHMPEPALLAALA